MDPSQSEVLPTGTVAIANGEDGVTVCNGSNTVIGGSEAGAGNLISGNSDEGIVISGQNAGGTTIEGNIVGAAANGSSSLANGHPGIEIENTSENTVEGNTVAYNVDHGVFVETETSTPLDNKIPANSIFDNGGQGIASALASAPPVFPEI